MSITAFVTGLATAASLVAAEPASEVAYAELAGGHSEAALRKLKDSGASQSRDPAVLINLAAAYAAVGKTAKAIETYRAAIASRDRYDLQLADGTWMDSRLAARTGLKRLLTANAQALR